MIKLAIKIRFSPNYFILAKNCLVKSLLLLHCLRQWEVTKFAQRHKRLFHLMYVIAIILSCSVSLKIYSYCFFLIWHFLHLLDKLINSFQKLHYVFCFSIVATAQTFTNCSSANYVTISLFNINNPTIIGERNSKYHQ